jgi:hypothetical protein
VADLETLVTTLGTLSIELLELERKVERKIANVDHLRLLRARAALTSATEAVGEALGRGARGASGNEVAEAEVQRATDLFREVRGGAPGSS